MSEPAVEIRDAAALFGAHRRRVWGLAYRLTGSAEDADDVVQETFARLIERPPAQKTPASGAREASAIGAWLARVATNLAIDALRRRRRRAYPGPWLPSAVEASDDDWLECLASPDPDAATRYDLLESATLAFQLALEALGPRQRAVLVLRDVLGHSAADTAEILGTREGNVRVLHLRARRALAEYEKAPCRPTRETRDRHRAVLERFLGCLVAQDAGSLEALLAEDVRTLTDAGGEYTALATPMHGRSRVARFYLRATAHRREGGPSIEVRTVNGLPAALIRLAHPVRRQAPRTVLSLELDAGGRIRTVLGVLAPRKLRAVRVDSPAGA